MSSLERPVDRGRRLASEALALVGSELRTARISRGLSVAAVAAAVVISGPQLSRIERGLAPAVPWAVMFRIAAAVGLDLTVKAYPGPSAIRDVAQTTLLAEFRAQIHASLRWAVEVPLPIAGDQRAWDGFVAGTGWRYGVEVETLPGDAQALIRRLNLKVRDGDVDGVLLVLRDTRRVRIFRREADPVLVPALPVHGLVALRRLAVGQDPGGSALILMPMRAASSQGRTPQV